MGDSKLKFLLAIQMALGCQSLDIVSNEATAERLATVYYKRILGEEYLELRLVKCFDDGPTWLIESYGNPNLRAADGDYPSLQTFAMRIRKSDGGFMSLRPIDDGYLRWRKSLRDQHMKRS